MENFQYVNPTKLIFGRNQVNDSLAGEVEAYGTRVLLVYGGGSIKKNGLYELVLEQLNLISNVQIVELSGVEPNPRLSTVNKGIQLIKENQLDFILAVGGGSVIDCAKAISVGAHYDGDVWDFVTGKAAPSSSIPLGTILTMAATGSEMNGNSVITNWDERDKRAFSSIHTYPKFSILDPQNTFSIPADQTVYGIVDLMSHVLEQYFHVSENAPVQERFGESILKTTIETAPKLLESPESYAYREVIMLNATFALNNMLSMGVKTDWATHMIEHAVSAVHDIPHGGGLAILFPHWMELVSETKPERVAQLGIRVFELDPANKNTRELAYETIQKLKEFWKTIGAPTKLSDYGIDNKEIDLMVKRSIVNKTIGNYVPLGENEVRQILERAL
ncbi:iron-containing alcohol dehydrogenase [Bacillus mangrovi]|uniref:Iron-containing alcohol dehydrogenase n=1 Tax=Metabacillus mangrovi TaxID=1491830 RepID=A0A7X2V6K1_9BACI|nr:iron-containing alcohol dehydrogenase [Metabacillus mangrovi]MTH55291.1 iron-containing alcohol dehydrogenase [Metabacillus mangrovi]